jgi:hypothetical protein
MKRTSLAVVLAFIMAAAGCQTTMPEWANKLPWSEKEEQQIVESKYQSPERLAAIWTPDVLSQPGQVPVRGFGGRFYFYNSRGKAVPVEGQLVVYAYDDTDSSSGVSTRRTPDRKYAFTPEQFTEYYSETDMGASYSVWVPWDQVGGFQTSVSLLPVFQGTNGKVVMGQQAISVLPGKARKPQVETNPLLETQAAAAVQPASHQSADQPTSATSPAKPQSRLRTTTIDLPRAMTRQLKSTRAESQNATDPPPIPAGGNPASASRRLPMTTENPLPMAPPAVGAAAAPTPTSTHSEHPRSPAPASPNGQSDRPAFGLRRHPAAPQFAHPFSQQPQTSSRGPGSWPIERQTWSSRSSARASAE